jgi:hypothetical protein
MAKMIAPILCIVPLATHCSVAKMLARFRLYRIGTYWPLNHIVRLVLRFSNACLGLSCAFITVTKHRF